MSARNANGSQALRVTDEEIARACRYIPRNGSLAAYFGIDEQRVADVRAGMRPTPALPSHKGDGKPDKWGTHMHAQTLEAVAAEIASTQLNARMWAVYQSIADRRGLENPLVAAVVHCGMAA